MSGRLGVPELDRLWARIAGNGPGQETPVQWAVDRIVLFGLGLGLKATLEHLLGEKPDLAAFEDWVVAVNGGNLPKERIDWVNDAVDRVSGQDDGASPSEDLPRPLDDEDLRFWEENGYVVLREAVPPDAAAAAAEAIWRFLGVVPDDPAGWEEGRLRDGLWVPLLRHPAFDANRASPRIKGAFAQLLGTGDLLTTIDQGGFNPPERPGRPFRGQGLHWDTSLVTPIPLDIQGILYLNDTTAEQGAFRCVPGFHRRIDDWLAALPACADPRAQDLSAEAVPVAGRAGDMVLWHAALPHGASPNCGVQPRLVQYIACSPVARVDDRPWR